MSTLVVALSDDQIHEYPFLVITQDLLNPMEMSADLASLTKVFWIEHPDFDPYDDEENDYATIIEFLRKHGYTVTGPVNLIWFAPSFGGRY